MSYLGPRTTYVFSVKNFKIHVQSLLDSIFKVPLNTSPSHFNKGSISSILCLGDESVQV